MGAVALTAVRFPACVYMHAGRSEAAQTRYLQVLGMLPPVVEAHRHASGYVNGIFGGLYGNACSHIMRGASRRCGIHISVPKPSPPGTIIC